MSGDLPVLHALPDPVGLAHPYAYSDQFDPAVYGPDPMGPGQHTLNYALEMDATGTWLAQSTISKVMLVNNDGNYLEMGELHLYHRIGEQWHHTFVESGVAYGGPARALRFTPDGAWLIVNRHGQFRPDGSFDYAYQQHSRRLQVYRRDGDRLVFHSFGPDQVWLDTSYSFYYGYGMDFDPTGRWLAVCGYSGFNGLLSFDPDTGTLAVASGTNVDLFNGGGLNPDGTPNPDFDYTGYLANLGANAYLAQVWNPADPSLLLRIGFTGLPRLYRRTGGDLVFAGTFTDTVGSFPTWHPSGKVISLVRSNVCGFLVPVMYAYPGGDVLGTLLPDTTGPDPSAYFGPVRAAFDPGGRYVATTLTYTYTGTFTFHSPRVAVFDPAGHPLALGADQSQGDIPAFGGYRPLAGTVPPAGGTATVWGHDPAGGASYLAIAAEDVIEGSGLDFAQVPDEWATPWGFRLYRIDGTAGAPPVVSILSVVMPDGTVTAVGTPDRPLGVVMPDAGTRVWPDTTSALYQMQPDGTWRTVIGVDAK